MEFRVLGPLEVVEAGAPIQLTARRQRALLAALLLRAGEGVSADALIEAVWSGSPPASAASILRLYLSQLRRSLPPGRLVRRQPGYALVVEPGELDAARFEELLAEARHALAEGNPRLARSLLDRALGLWRGAALADLAEEPFVRDEAARLEELRLGCSEDRFDVELALGRHAAVVADLERLVAEHPLRERLRRQLMLALYRAGRQADALACYRAGHSALGEELGLDPGPELRELERLILLQDPSLDLVVANGRPSEGRPIPSPVTETIGRERELAELERLVLSRSTRLITVVGAGGIGKTRLAVETAIRAGAKLADGAVLVELAPLRDPDLLLPAIGQALGLREVDGSSWPGRLGEHLRPLELLLVLDNLEHLVEGVTPLAALLAAAPRLTVVATSRTVLRLAAEQVFEVPPLAQAAAVELFTRRTLAAGASPAVVEASPEVVEQVCALLDGTPLAIELAAPWLRTLQPSELLGLLDSRLDTLQGGPRDAPARHRTLRSTIDWSYDLLDAGEQRLFVQLSVFSGGFTLESLLEVSDSGTAIAQLGALVEASVVQAGAGRHRLLEVVREYAAERLGDDAEPKVRHARHFTALAEAAEQGLSGRDQGEWLVRLDAEHDNLRAALDWLAACADPAGELRLAVALARFWYVRGHVGEGLARLLHALERAPASAGATVAKALRSASALALIQGDYALARDLVERSLALYRSLGDRLGAARSLSNLGAILHAQGELELAAATLDGCLRDCEELDDARLVALARNNRGDVALSQRDFDTAATHFESSLDVLRALGDTSNIARGLYNLGVVAAEQGRVVVAQELLGEGIALSHELGDNEDVAWCLIGLAAVAAETQRPEAGAQMLGAMESLLERIGAARKPYEEDLYLRTRATLQRALGDAPLARALDAGARLRLADVVRLSRETA
jgi:predicted ATPase/DNA-binding SARP family transcriptional activator